MPLRIEEQPTTPALAGFHSASMAMAPPRYSIIIPAYNEQARIGSALDEIFNYLKRENWSAEVIVVDDGSSDDTLTLARRFAAQNPGMRILHNPGNRGKGYSVRQGMLQARGQILLFTDADLSAPISEAGRLFAALESGAEVAIGSRWIDPSFQVQRQSLQRRALSRAYNLLLRMVLRLPYRDTQCGFKAFTRAAASGIFPRQRIMRWGFDAEILHLARRLSMRVTEVAVLWGHSEDSRIHLWRDGLRMAWDTLKIRAYSLTGKYNSSPHWQSQSSGKSGADEGAALCLRQQKREKSVGL